MLSALFTHPLGRWFQQDSGTAPPAQPRGASRMANRVAEPPFAMTQPGELPQRLARAPGARPAPMAARRPLVSASGDLPGFAFCVDSPQRARLRVDAVVARECVHDLLRAMRPVAEQGKVALAEVPASWLLSCQEDHLFARGMHLVLGSDALFDDPVAAAALVARLRGQGAKVGWRLPAGRAMNLPPGRPDFLPVTAPVRSNPESWRQAITEGLRRWPDTPQVLLDITSVEQLEALLTAPVSMGTLAVGVCDEPSQPMRLAPQALRLMNVLGVVAHDPQGKRLAQLLKSDPGLHQLLLEGLHAQFGHRSRGFASVERALAALGRHATHRHLAWMVAQQAPRGVATAALRLHALARARLTELLAVAAGEADPVALYFTGLGSVLPMLLRCEVDDALAPLLLPADAISALAEQTGPWMHYVALIRALERHDMTAVEALALPFGGLQAVLALSDEAWNAPV